MDIDTMPAGREMDALIAKEFMKWSDINEHDFGSGGKQWRGNPPNGAFAPLPFYSADLMNAWEIITKGLSWEMSFNLERNPAHNKLEWFAMIGDDLDDSAIAETAPLAICRAALKLAVGAAPSTMNDRADNHYE